MGKIKKLKDNNLVGGADSTDIYPVTSTKAVYDTTNKDLDTILTEVNENLTEREKYEIDTRKAVLGELETATANDYPFVKVNVDGDEGQIWESLNRLLDDIDTIATTKYNGWVRYFLSGQRIDVVNRVLYFGNKTTSQVATGPIKLQEKKLAYSGEADTSFYRIYKNSQWSDWKPVNESTTISIVQTTGTSTTSVMSQKAVTDALNRKLSQDNISQETGNSTTIVMSQDAVTKALNNSSKVYFTSLDIRNLSGQSTKEQIDEVSLISTAALNRNIILYDDSNKGETILINYSSTGAVSDKTLSLIHI